jgi:hypothetical protein
LSEAKAQSQSGGHFFLGDKSSNNPDVNNGAILTTSIIMRNVMSLAAEAECGALFNNTKDSVALRNTLAKMGHPQPPTPVQVENSTTHGFANKQLRQCKSKSMDMRFYWVQDRVEQQLFHVYWRPGQTNLADCFTKHHLPAHYRRDRATYLHYPYILALALRGCVNPAFLSHGNQSGGTLKQSKAARLTRFGTCRSQPTNPSIITAKLSRTTHQLSNVNDLLTLTTAS